MSYYKISCAPYKFYASIQEDTFLYKVRFGGKKAFIFFSVYKDEEAEYPNLDAVGFSPLCSYNIPLEDKEGTRVLVKSGIKFLCWRFPNIKQIRFLDTSKKKCQGDVQIPLPSFHFAKYGKTWYQDHFDAKPLNKNVTKYLERANVALDQLVKTDKFEAFWVAHVKPHLGKISLSALSSVDIYDVIKKHWGESGSFKDFFQRVSLEDCSLFYVWLDVYIKKLWRNMNIDVGEWYISRRKIDGWDGAIKVRETKHKPAFAERRTTMTGGELAI